MNTQSRLCFDHLDALSEIIELHGSVYRIVHIYASAPDYRHTEATGEGIACVDDAARAAVLFLRDYELRQSNKSKEKAIELIRFVKYMQRADGLFYNFVVNNRLEINTSVQCSKPEHFGWCDSRAIWALGTASRIFKDKNNNFAHECALCVRRALPHIRACLCNYPNTRLHDLGAVPAWLIDNSCADSTSVLLLGLNSFRRAYPDPEINMMIERLSQGVSLMQYGNLGEYPYGVHASWEGGWHAWGNSQTHALAETGYTKSAIREADSFYPWILVNGLCSSFNFDKPQYILRFPQVAYDIRCIVYGLTHLFKATMEHKYLRLAALASSWLMGNNVSGMQMYEPQTGICYDGIDQGPKVNKNSGAESTIEALLTIQELERHREIIKWMDACSGKPVRLHRDGIEYYLKAYDTFHEGAYQRIAVVLDLTRQLSKLIEGEELDSLLSFK